MRSIAAGDRDTHASHRVIVIERSINELRAAPRLAHRLHLRGRIAHDRWLGDVTVAIDHDAARKTLLREGIARHLESHPRAGDTPEGIIASWLPPRGYEDASLYIGEVLDAMVQSGELFPRPLPDGRTLYVRCPAPTDVSGDSKVK